jgi:hypothetical protein
LTVVGPAVSDGGRSAAPCPHVCITSRKKHGKVGKGKWAGHGELYGNKWITGAGPLVFDGLFSGEGRK